MNKVDDMEYQQRLWIHEPCVLVQHPLDVWPFNRHRSLDANANAAVRLVLYLSALLVLVTQSAVPLLLGFLVIALVTMYAYYREYTDAIHEPVEAPFAMRFNNKESDATETDALSAYDVNCQQRPWKPVEPTPLFTPPVTEELLDDLADGAVSENPLVTPQNPMGNPLTYDMYTAMNMDAPVPAYEQTQEWGRLYQHGLNREEAYPIPDPTRMALPAVQFPESSEANKGSYNLIQTGHWMR